MGGSSYDRDVYSSSSSSSWGSSYSSGNTFGASSTSRQRLGRNYLDASMKPNNKVLRSNTKTPIVIMLDVTGSNIDFARVVYDKLPMFYGQIEQKGYLKDFDISICAVGDAYSDNYPLQIGSFAKGIELDSWIEKLVLEGNGGGQRRESYELAAYYLCQKAHFADGSEPIIFFIGDEAPYETVNIEQARSFGISCPHGDIEPFAILREKVNDNIFMLLNKYNGDRFITSITQSWTDRLAPEHVIKINEEKSIVDLMLGIISMISFTRSLDDYKDDMRQREQSNTRIENVTSSLKGLADVLVKVNGNVTPGSSTNKSTQKGKRI